MLGTNTRPLASSILSPRFPKFHSDGIPRPNLQALGFVPSSGHGLRCKLETQSGKNQGMIAIQLLGGGILLLAGGEIMVKGAVAVASRLGISKMLIGLTLVGFGTSTPELVASVNAALKGSPGLAIGNIVGSNIANVFLILAVAALILPVRTDPRAFQRDGTMMLGSAILFASFCLAGEIGRLAAVVFLAALVFYTIFSYIVDKRSQDLTAQLHAAEADRALEKPPSMARGWLFFLAGLGGVLWGAELLVNGAITLARSAGVSETLIGLTLVAVGTSLPELVTSVMAAVRGHSDVAAGNIIGSNIFNVMGIAGVTALVKPIAVPVEIIRFDLWVMLGATVLMILFASTGWRINRREALTFLFAYVAYILSQFFFFFA